MRRRYYPLSFRSVTSYAKILVRTLFLIFCLCIFTASGCAVVEAKKDHDLIRASLLDLYTNQILDNLIRASNGLPIIHLDYTSAQGMVTNTAMANIGDSQTITNTSVLTAPASFTRAIATTLMGSLGFTSANQITLAAAPVTTSNEVYDAYLEFLSLPGSLMVSKSLPPPCAVHIWKKSGCNYYWIPAEYKGQFFKLSLLTTAERGRALLPPDSFFTSTITEVGLPEVDPQNEDKSQ